MANMWTIKLESPLHFKGQYDIEKVESWVCQIEYDFVLANVQNENCKAMYAILLLTKSATI